MLLYIMMQTYIEINNATLLLAHLISQILTNFTNQSQQMKCQVPQKSNTQHYRDVSIQKLTNANINQCPTSP